MSLFDSTISTLSNMAINEAGLELPSEVSAPAMVDELKTMLDQIPLLTEQQIPFPAKYVPIWPPDVRLGRYLIEAHDIGRYMLSNGIDSFPKAVWDIGMANGRQFNSDNVAIIIDEDAILQEMDDLGMNIGGSISNDGNIGTVGILGPHQDIGKFRRFANSREFIDTICNKYGFPLVKKNYTIGLIPVKHSDIRHDGNLQESAEEYAAYKKNPNAVLQEKPNRFPYKKRALDEDELQETTLSEFKANQAAGKYGPTRDYSRFNTGPASSAAREMSRNSLNTSRPMTNAEAQSRINTGYTGQGKYGTCGNSTPSVTHASAQPMDDRLQYIRDLAFGKYDSDILAEEYGTKY